ncbi:MAG: hypothetical protein AAF581_23155 [Planctomycetota bacterium]
MLARCATLSLLLVLVPNAAFAGKFLERLRDAHPKAVVEDSGAVHWRVGEHLFQVQSVASQNLLTCAGQTVRIPDTLAETLVASDYLQISLLLQRAANLRDKGSFTLSRSLVAEWALLSPKTVVIAEAVLHPTTTPTATESQQPAQRLTAFAQQIDTFLSDLAGGALDPHSQRATRLRFERLRKRLFKLAALLPRTHAGDLTRPSRLWSAHLRGLRHSVSFFQDDDGLSLRRLDDLRLHRRLIRHGWIERVLERDASQEHPLRAALAQAERPEELAQWQGEGAFLSFSMNAFGEPVLRLQTSERSVIVRPAFVVETYVEVHDQEEDPVVATNFQRLELPHRTNPEAPLTDGELTRAQIAVFANGSIQAQWRASDGLRSDSKTWRQVYPDWRKRNDEGNNYLSMLCPPHIAVLDVAGDLRALHTQHGSVPLPRKAPDNSEPFLQDVAKAFPGATHLDLFVNGFCSYVDDSPDFDRPYLLGFGEDSGDIHQTSAALLSEMRGGMLRGDCDDYSELLRDLGRRQGQLVHVIDHPDHHAVCWLEKRPAGWFAYVLDTDWGRRFHGDTPAAALAEVYGESYAAFTPDQLPIALRFAGEKQRQTFNVGTRVFHDRGYADAVIPAQQDWHRFTLHNALGQISSVSKRYSDDFALLFELALLQVFCRDHKKAAATLEQALAVDVAPISKLQALASVTADLPARYRQGYTQRLVDLFDEVPQDDQLAAAAMVVDLAPPIDARIALLDKAHAIVANQATFYMLLYRINPSSIHDKKSLQIRDSCETLLPLLIDLSHNDDPKNTATPEQRKAFQLAAGIWFENGAFVKMSEEPLLSQYALLGKYYEAVQGQDFLFEFAAASLPRQPRIHHQRQAPTVRALDLQWIKACPYYWQICYHEARKNKETAKLSGLLQRHRQALEWARKQPEWTKEQQSMCDSFELSVALHNGDLARIERALDRLGVGLDPHGRWAIAMLVVKQAKELSASVFADLIRLWERAHAQKQHYFAIAYALGEQPETQAHARQFTAHLRQRFADDPIFVAEADFILNTWLHRESSKTAPVNADRDNVTPPPTSQPAVHE